MQSQRVSNKLRQQLFEQAGEIVREIEKQEDVLAAILTGSAAWGQPNPDGDLDILLITRNQSGVRYRYMVPGFCAVERRTELGYIPDREVTRSIDSRYGTRLGREMLEQLKNGRVIFQKNGAGDRIIESCREVRPSRMVIGAFLKDIGEALRTVTHQEQQGLTAEMILTIRQAAKLCIRARLLAGERTAVSKEKHEHRAVHRYLPKHEAMAYEQLLDLSNVTETAARRTVDSAQRLIGWVLAGHSVSSRLVEYEH